jgi:hypothetical protein
MQDVAAVVEALSIVEESVEKLLVALDTMVRLK